MLCHRARSLIDLPAMLHRIPISTKKIRSKIHIFLFLGSKIQIRFRSFSAHVSLTRKPAGAEFSKTSLHATLINYTFLVNFADRCIILLYFRVVSKETRSCPRTSVSMAKAGDDFTLEKSATWNSEKSFREEKLGALKLLTRRTWPRSMRQETYHLVQLGHIFWDAGSLTENYSLFQFNNVLFFSFLLRIKILYDF